MPLLDLTGPVIAAGEALSEPLNCSGGVILRITMPGEWNPANLSFQIASQKEGPFSDLFTVEGRELLVPLRTTATVFVQNQTDNSLTSMAWIKFRSGPREAPVRQDAQRVFITTIDVPDKGSGGPVTPDAPTIVDLPALMVNGATAAYCKPDDELSLTSGNWTNTPTSYQYTFLLDGAFIASGQAYTVLPADIGHTLQGYVVASNAGGAKSALTNSATVSVVPSIVDPPVVVVNGVLAATCEIPAMLTASTGSWYGGPTSYWHSWLSDSNVVGSGPSYTTQPSDSGRTIMCSVTASNDAGIDTALSNSVVVTVAPA